MATHGHGDKKSLVVPEKKMLRKQQKMQMGNRKLQLRYKAKPNIPNDIVIEILSRSPAKSLVRLRWTCKYWFDLITSDHDFIKMHLHRSTTHDVLFSIISPSVLSLSINNNNYILGNGSLSEIFQCYLNYNNTTNYKVVAGHVSTIDVCIVRPYKHRPLESCYYNILGSCNGLILILIEEPREDLCIWNPCTKEYRILPRPLNVDGELELMTAGSLIRNRRLLRANWYQRVHFNQSIDYSTCLSSGSYGFGYDRTTDDYKVIRNTYSQCQVYTLGTHSWRWIKTSPYRLGDTTNSQTRRHNWLVFLHDHGEGVFVNGALYWIESLYRNIISFDIGKETFERVAKLPNVIGNDEAWHNVKLQVFEESLCVVLKIKEEQSYMNRAEMWVMKDYTVKNKNKESLWAKIITITNLHDCLFPIKPLRYTRNGEILMLNNHKDLFLCNPKNNKIRVLCKIFKHPNQVVKEVYSDSLVCLNSGTYSSELEPRKEQTKKKNKKMIYSLVSNQNKTVFREYMGRGVSNQNKNKIAVKDKLWKGRL